MGFWKRACDVLVNEDGYANPDFATSSKKSTFSKVDLILEQAGKKIRQILTKDAKSIFTGRNAKTLPFCSKSKGGTVLVRALPAILVAQNYDDMHRELVLRPDGLYIYERCTHRSSFPSIGNHYALSSGMEVDMDSYVKYGTQAARLVS